MPRVVVFVGDCLDSGLVDEDSCAIEDLNDRRGNVIQSEAKNLEYIKWLLPRTFATLWMTK